MENNLAVVKEHTAALSTFGTADLAVAEKVEALVRTAHEVNEQSKALKEQDTRVKDEFKRMCRPYTDDGMGVTCFAFDQGLKMVLTVQGGGMEVDEDALLKGIYEMYGEQVGDKGGKAWRAYCAISDPLEAPRKLNPDKLAQEVARAQRIAAGLEAGEIMVTEQVAAAATREVAPILKARCAAMTKAEVKAHEMGELTDVLVVK